eukprot:sb/3470212/
MQHHLSLLISLWLVITVIADNNDQGGGFNWNTLLIIFGVIAAAVTLWWIFCCGGRGPAECQCKNIDLMDFAVDYRSRNSTAEVYQNHTSVIDGGGTENVRDAVADPEQADQDPERAGAEPEQADQDFGFTPASNPNMAGMAVRVEPTVPQPVNTSSLPRQPAITSCLGEAPPPSYSELIQDRGPLLLLITMKSKGSFWQIGMVIVVQLGD